MRTLIISLVLVNHYFCFSQVTLYSCGDNGEIIEFNQQTCTSRSLGTYEVYGDIAVASEGIYFYRILYGNCGEESLKQALLLY